MDLHGIERSGCTELKAPYGIPFRCLIPQDSKNLLIASRAASFSSIAASSCRLSRTMMQLGQAAGTACFIALNNNKFIEDIDHAELLESLRKQNVELAWPRSEDMREYLKK